MVQQDGWGCLQVHQQVCSSLQYQVPGWQDGSKRGSSAGEIKVERNQGQQLCDNRKAQARKAVQPA